MTRMERAWVAALVLAATLAGRTAEAQSVVTVDQAVKLGLAHNTQIVGANANLMFARGSLYNAYSGILPRFQASWSRSGSRTNKFTGNQTFAGVVTPAATFSTESYNNNPQIQGQWDVLNLSNIKSTMSARTGIQASQQSLQATRNDVALAVRRQFYEVVRAMRLAEVATAATRLARDNEKRVRALFDVGSVSRSDLLQAQLRTSQAQVDSLTADQAIITQRILLSNQLAIPEMEMGPVDTALVVETRDYDEAQLVSEAVSNRPDLKAAESDLRAAKAEVTAANLARIPYVTVSGSAAFQPKGNFSRTIFDSTGGQITTSGNNQSDRNYGGTIALNWDVFSGMAIEGRIANAKARLLNAQESRDVIKRNLEAEVHGVLLAYREGVERARVATAAVASATENLKLIQQKYNVGSTTILDLNTAQVALQQAHSDRVAAFVLIRQAEAALSRVRGHNE